MMGIWIGEIFIGVYFGKNYLMQKCRCTFWKTNVNNRIFLYNHRSLYKGTSHFSGERNCGKLKELAEAGNTAVLIVPVAFVTDHVETAFELDIEIREEAKTFGIEYYEVTGGLNTHPLFIQALSESAISQIKLPGGNEEKSYFKLPKYTQAERSCRCHQCEKITEAVCWTRKP